MSVAGSHVCKIQIQSMTPYVSTRPNSAEKTQGESHDAYERRTWRDKAHTLADGTMVIPAMGFKRCIDAAASHKGEKIKGKGMKTWAGKFVPGICVTEPVVLGVKKDEVPGEEIYCHADGTRRCGTRVIRIFPRVDSWSGVLTIHVLDHEITQDVLLDHVQRAGVFIGVGGFAPRSGGQNGRFRVTGVEWV